MSFWSAILGAGGSTIAEPIDAVGNAFDKLFTSDDEKAQAAAVMEKLRQQPAILQAEITKLEAQHRSTYVAGWRPSIGWVCAASLAAYFIPKFTLAAILWVRASWAAQELQPYPVDGADLFQVIFAMLGLGAMRTVEKARGLTK